MKIVFVYDPMLYNKERPEKCVTNLSVYRNKNISILEILFVMYRCVGSAGQTEYSGTVSVQISPSCKQQSQYFALSLANTGQL